MKRVIAHDAVNHCVRCICGETELLAFERELRDKPVEERTSCESRYLKNLDDNRLRNMYLEDTHKHRQLPIPFSKIINFCNLYHEYNPIFIMILSK